MTLIQEPIANTPLGVDACVLVRLREFNDERGSLVVLEGLSEVPFEVRRVYYLYDFVKGKPRGGHAHKRLQQMFIAVSGAFDVLLDDGHKKKTVRLDNPARALFVCPMIWREIDNYAPGSVCLVLASTNYEERDYFRDYGDFVRQVQAQFRER